MSLSSDAAMGTLFQKLTTAARKMGIFRFPARRTTSVHPFEVTDGVSRPHCCFYDAMGNLVSLEILDASKRVTEARKVEFQTTA